MIKKIGLGFLSLVITVWLITFLSLRFETHQYAQLTDQQMAEAHAYLQGKFEPIHSDWQWQTFEPETGIKLRTGVLDAINPKGTIIVVPGFTQSIEMIMHEIVQLNRGGYRVAAIEYRGQGESWRPLRHPEKGYVQDYSVLANDVAQFAQHARIPKKPLFFFSISKGGHITMRMAAEHTLGVSAYALIVPMIKLNTGEVAYSAIRVLAGLSTKLGLGTMYAPGQSAYPNNELEFGTPIDCNANPDRAQLQSALFAERPTLRTRGVTLRWLDETIASTDKLLNPDYTQSIKTPTKIFTAGLDTFVNSDAAKQFCQSLHDCESIQYQESRHCIGEEDLDLYNTIIESSLRHFDAQLSL